MRIRKIIKNLEKYDINFVEYVIDDYCQETETLLRKSIHEVDLCSLFTCDDCFLTFKFVEREKYTTEEGCEKGNVVISLDSASYDIYGVKIYFEGEKRKLTKRQAKRIKQILKEKLC